MSIHFFELPKVPRELIPGDRVQEWMKIIQADTEEALEMVRANTENPMIDKAIDAIYHLIANEILREQIRVRQKAEFDYGNDIATARDEGREEGGRERRQRNKKEGKGRFYLRMSKKSTIFAADLRIYAVFNQRSIFS